MSYQVLARKWRPKLFQELMGQEHVVTVLMNALSQQRLHHAYLFTGTRGVGKTTIARIFAKSLNCEQGVSAEPCGQCDVCVDIDQGRFIDLLEIDAASRTKVDDTREILDNVQYAPTRGRYKVYLIDEVHMLSRSSFNALLKTLEEPPQHVKFILATTDPQKLPVTVLSRCLQFHLKALTVGQIEEKLTQILEQEEVPHEPGTLTLLAKAARGSMRDSLSLTDQAIAKGQGSITLAHLQQMLGGIDQNWVYKILMALLKQDSRGLMALSLEIASYTPNYSRLLAELIQLFHQIAMLQVVKQHFDLAPEHQVLLEKFSKFMSPEDVQLYYQIALNGRKDLPYAFDEQAAFDMVLLRLLAFKPVTAADVDSDREMARAEASTVPDFSGHALPQTQVASSTAATSEKQTPSIPEPAQESLGPEVSLEPEVSSLEPEINSLEPDLNSPDQEMDVSVQQTSSNSGPSEASLAAELESIEMSARSLGQMPSASAAAQETPAPEPESMAQIGADMAEQDNLGPDDLNAQQSQMAEAPLSPNQGFAPQNAPEPPPQALAEDAFQAQAPQMQNAQEQEAQPQSPAAQNDAPASTAVAQTPVDAVLATRNMLRSRKKAQESKGKKPDDAALRQPATNESPAETEAVADGGNAAPDIPPLETLPQAPYTPNVIDPANVRKANQVDKWANMIDTMALNGRLRQLAIHATISEASSDELLVLKLDQSTKHLKTDAAHQQLEHALSQYLQRKISVEIEVVEQTVADPYQIQADINDKRYDYAKALLLADDIVMTLQNDFQATLDEQTIAAL
ncbi:DNA polymerase III subunit gamma/tau [Thalassomonas viridans]|uniref:DNA polymerase III subunit gamma/tau n=1 Tax=Thalassomonas viridans TaxID=137584 RepID=A0AAE9YZP4_9GAMM|nr:DNA polymerase III subunit gamma/tau [Thalassomonas viridans]WDE03547.1 DNA polymerase III subunit gamma/tau [Thalassomonas viridans]